MPHRPLRALVSGASISGLTTAFWLARYGFSVTVVERAPHLRPGGQALDIRGPGLEIAERMGLLSTIREHRTRLTGMSHVDATGQETFRTTERTLTGGHFDSPDVEILRDDLCRILHDAVRENAAFLFDDSVVTLTQDPTGVDVTFETAAPARFDVVIGADGLHSRVRRITFGPERQFLRRVGAYYVATFGMPNFLGLERWEVFYQPDQLGVGAMIMGLDKTSDVRAYVGFSSPETLDYDYRDIDAQKRLLADRVRAAGWVFPEIVEHMLRAPDFHFDAMSQIRMDRWSDGRIVLVGDAGYSVSPATGQGTTVAMVGAYVLAGELATHASVTTGITAYEDVLRDYILRNQDLALAANSAPPPGADEPPEVPDFGRIVEPIALKPYSGSRA